MVLYVRTLSKICIVKTVGLQGGLGVGVSPFDVLTLVHLWLKHFATAA